MATDPFLNTLAEQWPEDVPLVCLAGTGRFAIVATALSEVAWEAVRGTALEPAPGRARSASAGATSRPASDLVGGASADLPFRSGLMGILPYDLFRGSDAPSSASRPRVFRVERALVVDRETGKATHTGDSRGPATAWRVADELVATLAAAARSSADAARLDADAPSFAHDPALAAPARLVPHAPDSDYLAKARQALEDIRSGRYYQINLLRYFAVQGLPEDPRAARRWLAARLARFGGPHAAWLDVPGLRVVSFSPERFVRVIPAGDELTVETCPIKGTAPRGATPEADRANAEALRASPKDRAELAMIVDLMRNDLTRVCAPATVRVPEAHQLESFANVHHLVARVTGRLARGLTLGALLDALCPGGSITGAPKREVMGAIRAYEGRERGFFMGHAFYRDDGGAFDSSILIRTLVRERENPYEFAAGSGIVVHSDPDTERLEIDAKGRVLTAP